MSLVRNREKILGKGQIQFSVLTVIDLFSSLINFNFVAIQHLTIFSPLPRCNDISRSLSFITQSLLLFGPTSLTIKIKCQTACNRWQGYFLTYRRHATLYVERNITRQNYDLLVPKTWHKCFKFRVKNILFCSWS